LKRSSGFDQISIETLNRRLWFVTIFVFVVFSLLFMRLWFLQIINGRSYKEQSENNRIHRQKITPFRGVIYDRNGEILASNLPSFNLYIIPEDIQDRELLLRDLKVLIGLDAEEVRGKLKKESKTNSFEPVLVKKNLTWEEMAKIETHLFNLPGASLQPEPQRNYIYGDFASHLIGYLGEISEKELESNQYPNSASGDYIGKFGIEGKWQKELSGISGKRQIEVDAAGRQLQVISQDSSVSGRNIALTIDRKLQASADAMLKDKSGAIVAMDPNNGEILAMSSSPSFDPNIFIMGIDKTEMKKLTSGKDSPFQNKAISGQYMPGSVFKIVMAIAGLEEGVITPDDAVSCTGAYDFGNRPFKCWNKKGHGSVNLHRAIRESCDVYFYKLGRKLGIDRIAYYARMCGLGVKTGIELDSEKSGLIPDSAWKLKRYGVSWQAGETLSCSIGQSYVQVTPLQAARLISVVFNGGKVYQPKIVRWVGDKNNESQSKPLLQGELQVKRSTLEEVKRGLIAVVNEAGGTGGRARVRQTIVAGKTGTAQVAGLDKKMKDNAWFVGIAPAENPKIAVAVIIERGEHGGSAAGPLAGDLIRQYLGFAEEIKTSADQDATETVEEH